MSEQRKTFQTEVRQMLDLVIHSLYSHAEIFLRELISNASDAIDRARFEAVSAGGLAEPEGGWRIQLAADPAARTLVIRDNGIGMSAEDLDAHLGTIASSGTKRFLAEARQAAAAGTPELIGQFGVGFYSAFMVADRVTVLTRRAGQERAWRWESTGDGTYTVAEADKASAGTEITLHLKEDRADYAAGWKIRELVRKYSNYIAFPIELREVKPAPAEGEKPEAEEAPAPPPAPEVLNSSKAIWMRGKGEVGEAEYHEFYQAQFHDYQPPLRVIPFSAEGATEFRALLFIPAHAPWDLFTDPEQRGLHLYVKRVFILNNCPDLVPAWMRFVKGVVDSADLPLNVSREILQDSALVRRIQKSLVARVLSELKELKEKDPDTYRKFHGQFGRLLREGIHGDAAHADKLKELLLYDTTATAPDRPAFLKDYLDRMTPDQKAIYYLPAASRAAAEASPLLEPFRARQLEVILVTDAADEMILPQIREYGGKRLVSVQEGASDLLTEEEKQSRATARQEETTRHEALLKRLGELLKDDVREVRLSDRLTDSPCCLVSDGGMGPHLERLMRLQAGGETSMFSRALELNAAHPVVQAVARMHATNPEDPALADYAALLRDQALLLDGAPVKEPARFARLLNQFLVQAGPAAR
jgi:molecular chaperone HtpG